MKVGIPAVALLLLAGLIWWQADSLERWWYMRFRGGDLMHASAERTLKMRHAGRSLHEFEEEHGRLPVSLDEWLAYDPAVAQHLAEPEYSIRGDYFFVSEALTAEEPRPLLEDPGIDWPGEPAVDGLTRPRVHKFRFGLLNDGTEMEYEWDEAEGKVVRMRAGTTERVQPWD